jgi:GAF domain-containing protein
MSRPLVGWLLAAFALTMLALAWGEVFAPAARITFGARFAPHGRNAIVTSVTPGSAAAHRGIRPGDLVDLSALSLSDRLRWDTDSPAGATLAVPVIRDGVRRTFDFAGQPLPAGSPSLDHLTLLIQATITLLIAALIVVLRPSLATAALVLYGAGSVTTFGVVRLFAWVPNPWFGAIATFIIAAFSTLPQFALLPFIVRFPENATVAGRRRTIAADAIFVAAAIFCLLEPLYEPIVFLSWGNVSVWIGPLGFAIVLPFAALAYRDASGESRRRIGWVIAGFLISAAAYVAFNLADFAFVTSGSKTALVVGSVSQLLSCFFPIALAYAILRHRVLDIGFALNRTVVYAVMTTLVVGVVSLVDWLTSLLLSQQRWALVVEALVTISFGFALNWIHARTERLIDRIVFRARHLAEKRVEYRIEALAFASSPSAVDEALAIDAPQILELSSAAVFGRISATAPFARNAAAGWSDGTVTTVDDDALLVRTLRALERPFFLEDAAISVDGFPSGAQRPVLAIPVVSQHELIGFALYGNRRDGASPDPEEIALLATLAAAAGTAYGAVEARQWRDRATALEQSLRAMAVPS